MKTLFRSFSTGGATTTLTWGGSGCPTTIGYWRKQTRPSSVVTNGLTIGGVNYTAAQLQVLIKPSGGNAILILGKHLIGVLLNLAAGAQHNASADAAITDAENLHQSKNLNLLTVLAVIAVGTSFDHGRR
jgi:hypothetical protein